MRRPLAFRCRLRALADASPPPRRPQALNRSGTVDLPSDQQTAQISAITLSENASTDDLDMPPIPTQMPLEFIMDDAELDVEDPEAARKDSWIPGGEINRARQDDITLPTDEDGMGGDHALERLDLADPTADLMPHGSHDNFNFGEPGDLGDFGPEDGNLAVDTSGLGSFNFGDQRDVSEVENARDSAGDFGNDIVPVELGEDSLPGVDGQDRLSDFGKRAADDTEISLGEEQFRADSMGDFGDDFGMGSIRFDDSASMRTSNRPKRRRMELDTETELRGQQIKSQLSDTSDIVRDFIQAPCTRKELQELEGASVDFSRPLVSSNTLAPELLEMYERLMPKSLEPAGQEEVERGADSLFGGADPENARDSTGDLGHDIAAADLGDDPLLDGGQRQSDYAKDGADDISLGMGNDMDFDAGGSFQDFDQGDIEGGNELSQIATQNSSGSSGSNSRRSSTGSVHKAGWSARTGKMLHVLDKEFDSGVHADEEGRLDFLGMLGDHSTRKTAALTFFELLVLTQTGMIKVKQPEAFKSIMVTKTVRPRASAHTACPHQGFVGASDESAPRCLKRVLALAFVCTRTSSIRRRPTTHRAASETRVDT